MKRTPTLSSITPLRQRMTGLLSRNRKPARVEEGELSDVPGLRRAVRLQDLREILFSWSIVAGFGYFRRSAVGINDFLHLGSLIVGTRANRMALWAAKAPDILEKVKRARMALA